MKNKIDSEVILNITRACRELLDDLDNISNKNLRITNIIDSLSALLVEDIGVKKVKDILEGLPSLNITENTWDNKKDLVNLLKLLNNNLTVEEISKKGLKYASLEELARQLDKNFINSDVCKQLLELIFKICTIEEADILSNYEEENYHITFGDIFKKLWFKQCDYTIARFISRNLSASFKDSLRQLHYNTIINCLDDSYSFLDNRVAIDAILDEAFNRYFSVDDMCNIFEKHILYPLNSKSIAMYRSVFGSRVDIKDVFWLFYKILYQDENMSLMPLLNLMQIFGSEYAEKLPVYLQEIIEETEAGLCVVNLDELLNDSTIKKAEGLLTSDKIMSKYNLYRATLGDNIIKALFDNLEEVRSLQEATILAVKLSQSTYNIIKTRDENNIMLCYIKKI